MSETNLKNSFTFLGKLPASKSLFNRALIIASYNPKMKVIGESTSDDVVLMKNALHKFSKNETTLDCGSAGTVLRFLAARVSRQQGHFTLTGSDRLLSRLPDELKRMLLQLGADVSIEANKVNITSWGWKPSGDAIHVPAYSSSQFASAIVLNAWDLEVPLLLILPKIMASQAYFEMTLKLVKKCGMKFQVNNNELYIPAHQKLESMDLPIEPDMSCGFAVSAFAALFGRADILGVPVSNNQLLSLQPDSIFPEILKKIGVKTDLKVKPNAAEAVLTIEAPTEKSKEKRIDKLNVLNPIDINIADTPDLFPVLCVLLSQANGISVITGFEHIVYKESNRLKKTEELLRLMGIKTETKNNTFIINGSTHKTHDSFFYFDPDNDHRMAMAAAIVKKLGYNIEILNPSVVTKSYPEFWQIAGVNPS